MTTRSVSINLLQYDLKIFGRNAMEPEHDLLSSEGRKSWYISIGADALLHSLLQQRPKLRSIKCGVNPARE